MSQEPAYNIVIKMPISLARQLLQLDENGYVLTKENITTVIESIIKEHVDKLAMEQWEPPLSKSY